METIANADAGGTPTLPSRLRHWRRTAAEWGVVLRCSANGGRALALGLDVSAEGKWGFGGSRTLRVKSGRLLAHRGGFFGETWTTKQVLRRDVSVAGAEDRSEEDR